MKQPKETVLSVNTKISIKASKNLVKYQEQFKLKTGGKITKMEALNKMLEEFVI